MPTPSNVAIERAEDGDVLVRVEVSFRKTSGKTSILVADDGSADYGSPLARTLAKAMAWRAALERGDYPSAKDMAAACNRDPSQFRHLLNLAFLSPRIIEAVLTGRGLPPDVSIARLLRIRSLVWSEQENELGLRS